MASAIRARTSGHLRAQAGAGDAGLADVQVAVADDGQGEQAVAAAGFPERLDPAGALADGARGAGEAGGDVGDLVEAGPVGRDGPVASGAANGGAVGAH